MPPTVTRDLVSRGLRGLLGQYMGAGGLWTGVEVVERLEHLARDVRRDAGAPLTAVLLISEWLVIPLTESAAGDAPDGGGGWWRAQQELNAAGIPVYGALPQGIFVSFPGGTASDVSLSLELVAQTTGGMVLPSTNDRAAHARRMLADLQARYRATVDAPASVLRRDGRLGVTTTRPGAVVRSARGYAGPS